jgi:hypothetical protein
MATVKRSVPSEHFQWRLAVLLSEKNWLWIRKMKWLILFSLLMTSIKLPAESTRLVTPKTIKIEDNVERTILDYSTDQDLGLNQMLAPIGWSEPIVALGYELRGIVISGVLGLEFKDSLVLFQKDDGFVIPRNTQVRIHNAGDVPLHLIEVLRPGHQDALVKTYQSFD